MALLEVRNLTKNYGKHVAVHQLSFDIQEGRCVALLGPNGAGKTTTLKMLSGLLTPTDGHITFIAGKSKDIRQLIGYLPQYPAFFNWMTSLEYLIFSGQLAHLTKQESINRALEMLDLVGLREAKNKRIGSFSGGMKQRLGLAQAMIHKPKLLILDEPVSALDPLGRREVLDLMRRLKQETTILFSTHVLHDAEEVCDEIIIIKDGSLAIQGDIQQVIQGHQQPVIRVQVTEECQQWLEQLQIKSYVEEIEIQKLTAKLVVTELEEARAQLLREVVENKIQLTKFEVGHTSLEELFVKVVQQ